MKKLFIAMMGVLAALLLVGCGASHDISGVYLDSGGDVVYALAKDGTYRWYTYDYNTFVWGNYTILDEDEVQIGTDIYSYVKDKNTLKLIVDSYVYFDGTETETAPATVAPSDKLAAESLVGAYSNTLNPEDIEPKYVSYRYFYQDGTYEEVVNYLFGNYEISGTYEVKDGNLFLTNESGDVSEYQVRIEEDLLFLYAKESGLLNENEVWRKDAGNS